MTQTRTRGAVLPLTRLGVWVLFVLAAANGLFLYFAADLSDTDYAWSIKPAISGALITPSRAWLGAPDAVQP